MRLVFAASDMVSVDMAKMVLDANGIDSELKNEYSSIVFGGGIGKGCSAISSPEIWVVNDADVRRAVILLTDAGLDGVMDDVVIDSKYNRPKDAARSSISRREKSGAERGHPESTE